MSKRAGMKGKRDEDNSNPKTNRKIALILGIILVLAGIAGVFINEDEDDQSVSDNEVAIYTPDEPEYEIEEMSFTKNSEQKSLPAIDESGYNVLMEKILDEN